MSSTMYVIVVFSCVHDLIFFFCRFLGALCLRLSTCACIFVIGEERGKKDDGDSSLKLFFCPFEINVVNDIQISIAKCCHKTKKNEKKSLEHTLIIEFHPS